MSPSSRDAPDLASSSPAYAQRFEGTVGRWFLDVQEEATRSLLEDLPRGTALDVGGGHGQLIGLLHEMGFETTVLGSGPVEGTMAEGAVRMGLCRYRRAPLAELPFPDAAFDVVLCYRILPHTAAWRALLAELCRVAGRAVVVEFPSARSVNGLAGLFFGLKQRIEGDTREWTSFRPGEIAAGLDGLGFRPTGQRAQYLFPMVLHRLHGSARVGRALEAVPGAVGVTRWLGSPVIVRGERE